MEPIPETRRAFDQFGPFGDDDDLQTYLLTSARLVRASVPSLVGLSLGSLQHGVTFTVEATSDEVAALDAMQYLDGGPCVDAAHDGEVRTHESSDPADPTDEETWLVFARSTAARHVGSTLTLPLHEAGEVVGTVNLYATDPHAFDGRHERVAAVFGARAEEAVRNADLGYETRRAAQQAPELLRDQVVISQAVGALMAARGLEAEAARAMVENAALRAGVDVVVVARIVLEAFEPQD